jgi:hypothetical protein
VADKIEERFKKIMELLDNAKRLALEENRKHFEMHDSHIRGLFSSVEGDLLNEKRDLVNYARTFVSKVDINNVQGNKNFHVELN